MKQTDRCNDNILTFKLCVKLNITLHIIVVPLSLDSNSLGVYRWKPKVSQPPDVFTSLNDKHIDTIVS